MLASFLFTLLLECTRPSLTAKTGHSRLLISHSYHSGMWAGGTVGVGRKEGEESAPSSHWGPQSPSVSEPTIPNVFGWWNPLGSLVKLEDHSRITAREAGTGGPTVSLRANGQGVVRDYPVSRPQETLRFKWVEESPEIVHTVPFRKETVPYQQQDSFLETSVLRKMVHMNELV